MFFLPLFAPLLNLSSCCQRQISKTLKNIHRLPLSCLPDLWRHLPPSLPPSRPLPPVLPPGLLEPPVSIEAAGGIRTACLSVSTILRAASPRRSWSSWLCLSSPFLYTPVLPFVSPPHFLPLFMVSLSLPPTHTLFFTLRVSLVNSV